MDDNFNTIPQNNNEGSAYNSQGTNPAETFNQQSTPQMPYNSNHTAPQMGTAPSGMPYGAPPNAGYNSQPNTNGGNYSAPSYPQPESNPYAQNYSGGYAPQPSTPKKNKGKSVFAILICVCIVIASVAIGISMKGDDYSTPSMKEDNDKQSSISSDAAKPNTEDSPITYSEYSGEGTMTPEQVYEYVDDINVGVIVYSQNQKAGEGSGIIVGEDENKEYTYIITAAHVISDSGLSVQVQFDNETEIDAEIVGYDTKTDIGVLKVKKIGFKAATFGNSDNLKVGQTVYAIGNPGGTVFFGSFTSGMISAIDRPVSTSSSAYDLPCIQHTAAINPGNSGGALVNEFGQVIGLNSSKITSTEYEGMGFAVPSNTMIEIYNELVTNGYVSNRPMLGISYYSVASDYTYSAIAWKNNLPYGSIVLAGINEESQLNSKGVKVGDIVTGVNGQNLDTTDILLEIIEKAKVGDKITLSICRLNNNGSINSKFDVTVELLEDKGETATTAEQTTDPFSSYFGNGFGY